MDNDHLSHLADRILLPPFLQAALFSRRDSFLRDIDRRRGILLYGALGLFHRQELFGNDQEL